MGRPTSISRVLLKISGESLAAKGQAGLDPDAVATVAEGLVDMAAEACGLDAIEIRRRNVMEDDSYPRETASGIPVRDLSHQACIDVLVERGTAPDAAAKDAARIYRRRTGDYRTAFVRAHLATQWRVKRRGGLGPLPGRRQKEVLPVLLDGRMGRDQVSEKRHEDDDQHSEKAGHRALVLAKVVPEFAQRMDRRGDRVNVLLCRCSRAH